MIRKGALALGVGLVLAGVALPNAGLPTVPKGHKVAEPPVRFEGTDKHADYVFYLHYWTNFGTNALVEVKGAEPIKLKFSDRDNIVPSVHMGLLAVERPEFEKRKKQDPSLKWLAEGKDGVLAAELKATPETIAPATVKEVPVTTYRVTLKDGKLSAEKMEPKKSGAANPAGMVPSWAFGLVSSLSIAWLGLWFARRGVPAAASK